MLEMIAALLRVLRRPPLLPLKAPTSCGAKPSSGGKGGGLFGWLLGGREEEESDTEAQLVSDQEPMADVPQVSPAVIVEHDGPLLLASWHTLCQHCPSLKASLKQKNPQLVHELMTLSQDEMQRANAQPRPSARSPAAVTPPRKTSMIIKEGFGSLANAVMPRDDVTQATTQEPTPPALEPAPPVQEPAPPVQVPGVLVQTCIPALPPVAEVPKLNVLMETTHVAPQPSHAERTAPNTSFSASSSATATPRRRLPSGSIGVTVPSATKPQHHVTAAPAAPGAVAAHQRLGSELSQPGGDTVAITDTSFILPSPEQVPEMPDAPLAKQASPARPLALTSPVPFARFMRGTLQTSKSGDPIDIKKPLII